MRDVSIIGVGMTPVAEHWGESVKSLAAQAAQAAVEDSSISNLDALYIGNAYSSTYSNQTHLGALIADHLGFRGIEAYSVEAGDASGGVALRTGYLAVASGVADCVMVIGAEKATDVVGTDREQARSVSLDAEFESFHGTTLPALAALLMRRYMIEYDVELGAFEGFSVNAHLNGTQNPNAMYRNALRDGMFANAPMIADPVSLFDGAPDGDGAACVILASTDQVSSEKAIKIVASNVTTDTMMLQDREDPLFFQAVQTSVEHTLDQADLNLKDIDFFELHDAFTIFSALTLEASGFAERGQGWKLAQDASGIRPGGGIPISTFGGLKSRGNPAGATGVYQAVEACLQLRNEAGDNQIGDAHYAMVQNMGGVATTVVTHILSGY